MQCTTLKCSNSECSTFFRDNIRHSTMTQTFLLNISQGHTGILNSIFFYKHKSSLMVRHLKTFVNLVFDGYSKTGSIHSILQMYSPMLIQPRERISSATYTHFFTQYINRNICKKKFYFLFIYPIETQFIICSLIILITLPKSYAAF